jgi:hypothetical protein
MPERVRYRTDRVASEEQYLNTVTVQGPDCPVPPWSRTAGRAAHTAALSFPQRGHRDGEKRWPQLTDSSGCPNARVGSHKVNQAHPLAFLHGTLWPCPS